MPSDFSEFHLTVGVSELVQQCSEIGTNNRPLKLELNSCWYFVRRVYWSIHTPEHHWRILRDFLISVLQILLEHFSWDPLVRLTLSEVLEYWVRSRVTWRWWQHSVHRWETSVSICPSAYISMLRYSRTIAGRNVSPQGLVWYLHRASARSREELSGCGAQSWAMKGISQNNG